MSAPGCQSAGPGPADRGQYCSRGPWPWQRPSHRRSPLPLRCASRPRWTGACPCRRTCSGATPSACAMRWPTRKPGAAAGAARRARRSKRQRASAAAAPPGPDGEIRFIGASPVRPEARALRPFPDAARRVRAQPGQPGLPRRRHGQRERHPRLRRARACVFDFGWVVSDRTWGARRAQPDAAADARDRSGVPRAAPGPRRLQGASASRPR